MNWKEIFGETGESEALLNMLDEHMKNVIERRQITLEVEIIKGIKQMVDSDVIRVAVGYTDPSDLNEKPTVKIYSPLQKRLELSNKAFESSEDLIRRLAEALISKGYQGDLINEVNNFLGV